MSSKKYLDSPIFSIVCLPDSVLVSLGGGGKRFGLVNTLQLFPKPIHGLLKNPIHTLELGDEIFERLRLNLKTGLIVCNSEDKCVILQVRDNQISIITKFQTDKAIKEAYQNDGLFNYQGDTLATGGEDGILKVWTKEYQLKFSVDMKARIQSLDYNVNNGMLIVATDNEECKILKDNHVLHKLDISQNNVHKLKFHSAFFSLDGSTIFTFKNPMRGNSYMTCWKMESDNIRPIKTIKIHGHPVVSNCLSKEGMFLGVGCSDGTVKIINTRFLDTESQGLAHEMPCKALCFTPDSRFMISGSADFTYNFLQNTRPQGWFSFLSKLWLLGMILAYVLIQINDLFL